MFTPAQNPRGAAKIIFISVPFSLLICIDVLSHQNNRTSPESSNGIVDHEGFGPGRASRPRADAGADSARLLTQSERLCRRIARSHYENFLVASILLPRRLRQPFFNVYAFCRTADDLADESPTKTEALESLEGFQRRLDAIFQDQDAFQDQNEGSVPHAEPISAVDSADLFVALRDTVERFELPQRPFDNLLDAFRQDQHQTRYETLGELLNYCQRSANPVGRIVLSLGDCLDETNAQLSDQICTGLQLANFWQDVRRDHAIGRIYVPRESMSQFGVTEAMFEQRSTSRQLRRLLASECDRAESYLQGGLPLVQRVPRWLAADVRLFAQGGLATLQAIRAIGFDVLKQRPVVSKWRQLGMLAWAAVRR